MYAKFMALPFIARRASDRGGVSLRRCGSSVHLPKSGFSETLLHSDRRSRCLWAIGILVPFLKVTFFVLQGGVCEYIVRYK